MNPCISRQCGQDNSAASNLSILAPKAGTAEAMAFALRYKLPCWGMISMAGLDDVYVVPGPYMEL